MGVGEGREREKEGKRRLQHHLQRTRQGKAVHNRKRIKIQTRRKNPTKQKTVPTGFYMVLVVVLHKKIESVMGKYPSALETCISVFLHQLKPLPKKQSSHQYKALVHKENAKTLQWFSTSFLKKNHEVEWKELEVSILFLLWRQCESYTKWGRKSRSDCTWHVVKPKIHSSEAVRELRYQTVL